MKGLGQRLRDRARELGLADATVAERLGLSQQRYQNYVSDQTEPDLETLVRICHALSIEPNIVLGFDMPGTEADDTVVLRARITAAASIMGVSTLRVTAAIVDTMAKEHEPAASLRPARKRRG